MCVLGYYFAATLPCQPFSLSYGLGYKESGVVFMMIEMRGNRLATISNIEKLFDYSFGFINFINGDCESRTDKYS